MKKAFLALIFIFIIFLIGCSNRNLAINENSTDNKPQNEQRIEIAYNTQASDFDAEYTINNGVLYGRGSNTLMLFGDDSEKLYDNWVKLADNVVHIDACNGAVIYLTEDGKIYGMGCEEGGALQTNGNEYDIITEPKLLFDDCKYVSLGTRFALAIKNNNTLWFWGESKNGQSTTITDAIYEPVKIADNVQFAKAFGYTSAWIDNTDALYLCGDNSFNQIGNGNNGSGFPTLYEDIVEAPFCALKDCISCEVTDDMVILAKTKDGVEYTWGNHCSNVPTKK